MTRFLIVDDEPIAHRIIEKYAESMPQLIKAGNCYNAFEAMQFLNQEQVDNLNMVKYGSNNLLSIINDILDISILEKNAVLFVYLLA